MKPYKLIKETSDHFILHDGKAHFHVAKSGISEPTADKIRSFANGGKTVAGDITQSENKKNMRKIDANIEAAKHYAEGGTAEKYELPPIPESNLDEDYKPTPLPTPEEPPKRRQIEVEMPEPQARSKGGEIKHDTKNIQELDKSMHQFLKEEEAEKLAHGGKLDANARKHIAAKNFAGPDRSYPIEDVSHARNALARVSQHGSPELQAQVRAKVHSKYPGIEQSKATGGEIEQTQEDPQPTPDPNAPVLPGAQSFQDSFRKKTHAPKDQPYAGGGPVASNAVQDISHETQSQAIGRYAAGNPANLSKGGHVHHNAGKNQLHFHFYDGAVVPTQLDKEEGAGPQQASPLDKYVGGEPAQGTPLDNYADGGDVQPSNSDKLAAAAQEVQQNTDAQNSTISNASADQASTPEMPASSEAAAPVPQSQQIPAVPKPLPPTPDQQPQMLNDFDKQLALEKQGIQEGANALSQGYQQTAKAIGENVLQQKQQMDDYKLHADQITAQNEQLFNAVASSKVDPNHFWNSKSTGSKIAATIGVLLGGAASGMAGGSGQNQGLMKLNSLIQEDIDAQKNDQSNKMNLYKMGLEKYRDAQSAQQFATLQSNALLQGTLAKIAATTGNIQAQASAHQWIGQIGVQNAGLRSELAMKSAAMNAMNQPQQAQSGVNPDKMRLLINAGVIPKEEVPTAMKEFGEYQKLSNSLDEVDKVFNDAHNDSTYTQRIAEGIPGGSLIPTVREKTKQFQAETNSLLDKYTKDLTGRVTPQSMQNLQHSIPQAGDSPETMARKLNSFKDIVREAYTFPTLQSYRLLHPNDPKINSSATRQKKFTEGKPR